MTTDKQMLQTYRHDAHKFRGRSHDSGANRIAGVTVNLDVPFTADGDAAKMSRPSGRRRKTVDGHKTHYRLSVLTGNNQYDTGEFSLGAIEEQLHDLLAIDDAQRMHRRWLESSIPAGFNEDVYYPYTSLKYHTLLVGALVDLYRNDHGFADLHLVVDQPAEIVPYRTIYHGNRFALRLAPAPEGECANIPNRPYRSWASTWQRLTRHPINTDYDKFDMMLDANLRRIVSWSTALQYLEDYQEWREQYE